MLAPQPLGNRIDGSKYPETQNCRVRKEGLLAALARHKSDAVSYSARRSLNAQHLAVEGDRTRADRNVAKDRSADDVVARAAQSNQSNDLAGKYVQIDGAGALGHKLVDRQHQVPGCRRRLREEVRKRPSDYVMHQRFRGRVGHLSRSHPATVAEHCYAICNAEHFVQAVSDIDYAKAAGP